MGRFRSVTHLAGMIIYPPGTKPRSQGGDPHPIGIYRPTSWADEELKIVRFTWALVPHGRPGPSDISDEGAAP